MSSSSNFPPTSSAKSSKAPKESTSVSRQTPKRKVRSNPSSPRNSPSKAPQTTTTSKSSETTVTLGKARDLVPYFPESSSNQVTKQKLRTKSRSLYSPSPAHPGHSTSTPKSPLTARQGYAGAAFANSPPPECLPRPSFLENKNDSDLDHSGPPVSRALVFEEHSAIRSGFSFAQLIEAFSDSSDLPPVPTIPQLYQPHIDSDPSTHLKRLLNIAVA